jgi:hypothetical protein
MGGCEFGTTCNLVAVVIFVVVILSPVFIYRWYIYPKVVKVRADQNEHLKVAFAVAGCYLIRLGGLGLGAVAAPYAEEETTVALLDLLVAINWAFISFAPYYMDCCCKWALFIQHHPELCFTYKIPHDATLCPLHSSCKRSATPHFRTQIRWARLSIWREAKRPKTHGMRPRLRTLNGWSHTLGPPPTVFTAGKDSQRYRPRTSNTNSCTQIRHKQPTPHRSWMRCDHK